MDLEPYLPCCLFCIGVAEKPQTHHLFKKHLLLCPLCIVHSWILGKRRKINHFSQILGLTVQWQDIQVTTIYSAKGSKNLMVPCVLSMKKVTCLYKACSLCLQLIVCNLAWQEKWEIIPNTHKLSMCIPKPQVQIPLAKVTMEKSQPFRESTSLLTHTVSVDL